MENTICPGRLGFELREGYSAALAMWRERSATATMTAKPVENFTNSVINGSIRRRVSLFIYIKE